MRSIVFSFILMILVGFNTKAQGITDQEVMTDLQNGIVSFVNTVKNTIEPQSSYADFKEKLIGAKNMMTITKEGDDLLNVTYELIKKGASDEEIVASGLGVFSKATLVVMNYEIKNGFFGPEFNEGSIFLFGGGEAGLLSYKDGETPDKCGTYKECKHWYSIGCHLRNIGVWSCKNAETLIKVATFIMANF